MSVLILGTLELAYSTQLKEPSDWTTKEQGELKLDTDPYLLRLKPVEPDDYMLGKVLSLTLRSMRQPRGQGEMSFASSGELLENLARYHLPEPGQSPVVGFLTAVIGDDFHHVMTSLLVEEALDMDTSPPVWWRLRCYLKGAAVPDEWFYSLRPSYKLVQVKPALHPLAGEMEG